MKIIGIIPVASALSWTIILHFGINKIFIYKISDVDKNEWEREVNKSLKNAGILELTACLIICLGIVIQQIFYAYYNQALFIAYFMDSALFAWLMLSWMYFYVGVGIKGIRILKTVNKRTLVFIGLILIPGITYLCIKKNLKCSTNNSY